MRDVQHDWLLVGWHYTKHDEEPGSQRWKCHNCGLELIARVRPNGMICPALAPQPTFPRMLIPPDVLEEVPTNGC